MAAEITQTSSGTTRLLAATAAVGVLACAIAGSIRLNFAALELAATAPQATAERLPHAELVKTLAAGYEQLAADYFWLETIQYFGEPSNNKVRYPLLADYVDLVIGVDERFCYAYVFAGNSIPWKLLEGSWTHTQRAIAILRKGQPYCSDDWRVPFLLGYNLFMFTDSYREAADAVAVASSRPRAPPYLASLASRLYGQEGDLESALSFAQLKLGETIDAFAKSELEERIRQIKLELDLRRLNAAVAEYVRRRGTAPSDLPILVDTGILERIPQDPYGDDYLLENGTVKTRHPDKLLRLQIHPGGHLREATLD